MYKSMHPDHKTNSIKTQTLLIIESPQFFFQKLNTWLKNSYIQIQKLVNVKAETSSIIKFVTV